MKKFGEDVLGARASDEPVGARPTIEGHVCEHRLQRVGAQSATNDDGRQAQQVADDRPVGAPSEIRAERSDPSGGARRPVRRDPGAAGAGDQRRQQYDG